MPVVRPGWFILVIPWSSQDDSCGQEGVHFPWVWKWDILFLTGSLWIYQSFTFPFVSPKSLVLVPFYIAQINLATTSAAQLISRSQSVSSPSATTLTQSVLLGNTTSPPLNQSQAQMYLRVSHTQLPVSQGHIGSVPGEDLSKSYFIFNHSYPAGLRQANLLLPYLL